MVKLRKINDYGLSSLSWDIYNTKLTPKAQEIAWNCERQEEEPGWLLWNSVSYTWNECYVLQLSTIHLSAQDLYNTTAVNMSISMGEFSWDPNTRCKLKGNQSMAAERKEIQLSPWTNLLINYAFLSSQPWTHIQYGNNCVNILYLWMNSQILMLKNI